MNKKIIFNSIILSAVIFSGVFLFCQPAQAGIVQFGDKDIFVDFNGLPFDLNNWAPGMSEVKNITIENDEDFDINLYFKAKKTSGDDILADALTVTISGKSNHLSDLFNNNIIFGSINSGSSQGYNITIIFDASAENEYQGKNIDFNFIVTAEEIGENSEEISPVVIPGGGEGGGSFIASGLIISNEMVSSVGIDTVTITWGTNLYSTSRVIYSPEGFPHLLQINNPPNYGYVYSTEEDSNKVINHSVTITGLLPSTTYYYRTISHASPDTISREYSFTTLGETEVQTEEEIETGVETGEAGIVLGEETEKREQEIKEITEEEISGVEEGQIVEQQEKEAKTEAESKQELPLLAAVGNILSFGTGNVWIAVIIGIIILIVILLIFLWIRKKKSKQQV